MDIQDKMQRNKSEDEISRLYETFECKICLEEVETQEHVYKCKEIWKLSKNEKQPITNYEQIINGDVEDQIKISRIIRENMKIIDR